MLQIGWATRDFTPERPAMIQGQMHRRIGREALDPLMVTALAFYDHRRLYEGDTLKPQSQLTRREALMVADYQVEENFVGVGEKAVHVGYTKKVRLVDRAPYLNMLLKWHRAFPTGKTEPAKEPTRPMFNTQGWSEEDWQAFKRLYQKSQQPPVDVTNGRS